MEDHEKNLLLLIVIGASIGFAKLLVSDEELTWRALADNVMQPRLQELGWVV